MEVIDWPTLRIYAHVAAGSLTAALAISVWLARGKYILISRAMLASGAFWLASLWFWGLGSTVKDHALMSREAMIPLLASLELGFVTLGWAWFAFACTRTFTIKRKDDTWLII